MSRSNSDATAPPVTLRHSPSHVFARPPSRRYRPLAPSVLDERAGDWFEGLSNGGNASPFMSITTNVRPEKCAEVPAVRHVDDSARLQTVSERDSPLYHRLISAFFRLTGVPMVLNTSFNRKGQPIVESPLTVGFYFFVVSYSLCDCVFSLTSSCCVFWCCCC